MNVAQPQRATEAMAPPPAHATLVPLLNRALFFQATPEVAQRDCRAANLALRAALAETAPRGPEADPGAGGATRARALAELACQERGLLRVRAFCTLWARAQLLQGPAQLAVFALGTTARRPLPGASAQPDAATSKPQAIITLQWAGQPADAAPLVVPEVLVCANLWRHLGAAAAPPAAPAYAKATARARAWQLLEALCPTLGLWQQLDGQASLVPVAWALAQDAELALPPDLQAEILRLAPPSAPRLPGRQALADGRGQRRLSAAAQLERWLGPADAVAEGRTQIPPRPASVPPPPRPRSLPLWLVTARPRPPSPRPPPAAQRAQESARLTPDFVATAARWPAHSSDWLEACAVLGVGPQPSCAGERRALGDFLALAVRKLQVQSKKLDAAKKERLTCALLPLLARDKKTAVEAVTGSSCGFGLLERLLADERLVTTPADREEWLNLTLVLAIAALEQQKDWHWPSFALFARKHARHEQQALWLLGLARQPAAHRLAQDAGEQLLKDVHGGWRQVGQGDPATAQKILDAFLVAALRGEGPVQQRLTQKLLGLQAFVPAMLQGGFYNQAAAIFVLAMAHADDAGKLLGQWLGKVRDTCSGAARIAWADALLKRRVEAGSKAARLVVLCALQLVEQVTHKACAALQGGDRKVCPHNFSMLCDVLALLQPHRDYVGNEPPFRQMALALETSETLQQNLRHWLILACSNIFASKNGARTAQQVLDPAAQAAPAPIARTAAHYRGMTFLAPLAALYCSAGARGTERDRAHFLAALFEVPIRHAGHREVRQWPQERRRMALQLHGSLYPYLLGAAQQNDASEGPTQAAAAANSVSEQAAIFLQNLTYVEQTRDDAEHELQFLLALLRLGLHDAACRPAIKGLWLHDLQCVAADLAQKDSLTDADYDRFLTVHLMTAWEAERLQPGFAPLFASVVKLLCHTHARWPGPTQTRLDAILLRRLKTEQTGQACAGRPQAAGRLQALVTACAFGEQARVPTKAGVPTGPEGLRRCAFLGLEVGYKRLLWQTFYGSDTRGQRAIFEAFFAPEIGQLPWPAADETQRLREDYALYDGRLRAALTPHLGGDTQTRTAPQKMLVDAFARLQAPPP